MMTNWACRIECRCGQTAPPHVLYKAKVAKKRAQARMVLPESAWIRGARALDAERDHENLVGARREYAAGGVAKARAKKERSIFGCSPFVKGTRHLARKCLEALARRSETTVLAWLRATLGRCDPAWLYARVTPAVQARLMLMFEAVTEALPVFRWACRIECLCEQSAPPDVVGKAKVAEKRAQARVAHAQFGCCSLDAECLLGAGRGHAAGGVAPSPPPSADLPKSKFWP